MEQSHYRIIADQVRQIIIDANRGQWPANYREWKTTARRLGMRLYTIKTGQLSFAAELVNDDIAVRHVCDPILHRWIAHEVTEGILRREGREPCVIQVESEDPYHAIARLVESMGT